MSEPKNVDKLFELLDNPILYAERHLILDRALQYIRFLEESLIAPSACDRYREKFRSQSR